MAAAVDQAIAAVGALVFVLTATSVLSHRHRLYVAAVLAVLQIATPVAPAFVLWVALIALFAGPGVIGQVWGSTRLRWPQMTLLGITCVSLLWTFMSIDRAEGIQVTIRYALLLVVIALFLSGPTGDRLRVIDRALAVFAMPLVAQSIVTMYFRINPGAEDRYLHSSLGRLLIGNSLEGLFTTARNNVLDPLKSGGLAFVNGNVNAMFLGSATFALLYVYVRRRSRLVLLAAGISYVGVFFTGSKTGLALAIALPSIWLVLAAVAYGRGRAWIPTVGAAALIVVLVAPTVASEFAVTYRDAADLTMHVRWTLWDIAGKEFLQHPILGLGYGGWIRDVAPQVGLSLPPHNSIVAAWANGGLVLAVMVCLFMGGLLLAHFRELVSTPSLAGRLELGAALCSLAWVFAHGMADNTNIYGDQHSLFVVAALVAAMLLRRTAHTDQGDGRRAPADSGRATSPSGS